MCLKLLVFMLIIYIQKISCEKLTDFTKCPSTNICGDNAKCFDKNNGREYNIYNEAYCRCKTEYYGFPPNCTRVCNNACKSNQYCNFEEKTCKTGCRSHDDCPKNEVCSLDKICVKGCLSNSECKSNEYCDDTFQKCVKNCEKDFAYSRPVFLSSEPEPTYKPCGENGICTAKNHRQYCSCADNYFAEGGKGCRKMKDSDVIPQTLDCSKFCGKNALCKLKNEKIYCYCRQYTFGNPLIECEPRQFIPPPPMAIKPGEQSQISASCAAILCVG